MKTILCGQYNPQMHFAILALSYQTNYCLPKQMWLEKAMGISKQAKNSFRYSEQICACMNQ